MLPGEPWKAVESEPRSFLLQWGALPYPVQPLDEQGICLVTVTATVATAVGSPSVATQPMGWQLTTAARGLGILWAAVQLGPVGLLTSELRTEARNPD